MHNEVTQVEDTEYDRLKAQQERILAKRRAHVLDVLQQHHDWHLAQTDEDEHGIVPAEAYCESKLCDQTVAALRQSAPPARADVVEAVKHVVTEYFGVNLDQFDTVKRDLAPVEDIALAALRTNQAPTDAPEAGLAGELAGRIESRLRAFVAADKGSANEARQAIALADLIGCNERAILAALNHADPASDDVRELLREARVSLTNSGLNAANQLTINHDHLIDWLARVGASLGDPT